MGGRVTVGALAETVRCGAVVDGAGAPGERWRWAIADEIVRGLTDPATQRRAEREAPEAVAGLGWDGVAVQMAGLIDGGRP